MKILWLTWKDLKHPLSGGAERVNEELAKRLAQDGHEVIFLTAKFPGAKAEEIIDVPTCHSREDGNPAFCHPDPPVVIPAEAGNHSYAFCHPLASRPSCEDGNPAFCHPDPLAVIPAEAGIHSSAFCHPLASCPSRAGGNPGYKVIRLGSKWTVYYHAYKYYKKNLQGWPDLVIDEVNTIPFFAKFYVKEKNILFVHQLCREIWFYQMFFPLNVIGYVLEPLYLRALNNREVITVSESTKKDLLRCGFKEENINIISEGIDIEPVEDLEKIRKYEKPTLLSFGSVREMKRTDHILKAFEIAKEKNPALALIVAGDYDNEFGRKVFALAEKSKYADSIKFLGKVDKDKKIELFQKSHILLVASVKEGWGLIVTEANSQGTPAIVYDVDGLRDSVRHDETGIICKNNSPSAIARNIEMLIGDKENNERMRRNAWQWSKEISFEIGFKDFRKIFLKIR